jgi:hypothetical protein
MADPQKPRRTLKIRLVMIGAIAIVLTGATSYVALAMGSGSSGPAVGPEKQAAITSDKGNKFITGAALKSLISESAQNKWSTTTDDFTGGADAIAAIKLSVPGLTLGVAELNESPAAASARRMAVTDSRQVSKRHASVAKLWDQSVLTKEQVLVDANQQTLVGDQRIESFDAVQQRMNNWNKIHVTGDLADVVVTGTSRRHAAGAWIDEGTMQWHLTLHKEPTNRWLLVNEIVLNGADNGH